MTNEERIVRDMKTVVTNLGIVVKDLQDPSLHSFSQTMADHKRLFVNQLREGLAELEALNP
jgi:hypothetical protein